MFFCYKSPTANPPVFHSRFTHGCWSWLAALGGADPRYLFNWCYEKKLTFWNGADSSCWPPARKPNQTKTKNKTAPERVLKTPENSALVFKNTSDMRLSQQANWRYNGNTNWCPLRQSLQVRWKSSWQDGVLSTAVLALLWGHKSDLRLQAASLLFALTL